MVYIGTNLNLDLLIQSIFWIFCLSLIPKDKSIYNFKNKSINIFTLLLIFYLHLNGESTYYKTFAEEFNIVIKQDNFFLFSTIATLLLVFNLLVNCLNQRVNNLINYFPYLFIFIGVFNSFNLNLFIYIFMFFGIDAILKNKFNKKVTLFYSIFLTNILFLNTSENYFFDIDKLKGFSSSSSSFLATFYYLLIFYLIITGFNHIYNISKNSINLETIRKNFILSGSILVIIGVVSAISPIVNFYSYYYLGLNKLGMNTLMSIDGNTWRGVSPSAEAVGEFYSLIILFTLLTIYIFKLKIKKIELLLIIIICYGLLRSNNFAAISSLIFFSTIFIWFYKYKIKNKIVPLLLIGTITTIALFNYTPYSTKYLSKAMLYHATINSEFSIDIPLNEVGESFVDKMSFGEILALNKESSNLSKSLYKALEIYNNDKNIKYIPNPVTIISSISVPINRSEKWGIFLAKYNPSITQFIFGYGPNQLSQYYLSHPTKVNTGLVLPHSSVLNYLIFFGLFGIVFVIVFLIKTIRKNLSNDFFIYLLIFQLINLIKSDSILYLSNFILFLFILNIPKINKSLDYE